MFDWRNTSFEIRDGSPQWAILPLAAIERHGPHLPVATDLLIMEAISRGVAARSASPSLLLPVFPYGTSLSHAPSAGTLWLGAETLYSVVQDVVHSLHAQGINRVAVLNNHGDAAGSTSVPRGNFIVKTAVRQLNYAHPDRNTIWVQPFAAAGREFAKIFGGVASELHAGAVETSLLLHLRPEWVAGRPSGFAPQQGKEFLDFVPFAQLCPDGVWGDPGPASAEKGASALEAAIACTLDYIDKTLQQLNQLD